VRKSWMLEGPGRGNEVLVVGGLRLSVFERRVRDLLCAVLLIAEAILRFCIFARDDYIL
jgi:hypothetical protein